MTKIDSFHGYISIHFEWNHRKSNTFVKIFIYWNFLYIMIFFTQNNYNFTQNKLHSFIIKHLFINIIFIIIHFLKKKKYYKVKVNYKELYGLKMSFSLVIKISFELKS